MSNSPFQMPAGDFLTAIFTSIWGAVGAGGITAMVVAYFGYKKRDKNVGEHGNKGSSVAQQFSQFGALYVNDYTMDRVASSMIKTGDAMESIARELRTMNDCLRDVKRGVDDLTNAVRDQSNAINRRSQSST